jgi:tetratricopeptide (TPR) repeat protein/CRP-like cAMP-binding protein
MSAEVRGSDTSTFWGALEVSTRAALQEIGRVSVVRPYGTLCLQGVLARDVMILLDGYAKEFLDSADGDEAIVELLGPGDLDGELATWGHPQRATVMALGEVRLLRISGREFAGLVETDPRISAALMAAMAARRTRGARRHAIRAAGRSQRLALHLLELVARFGRPVSGGVQIPVPLSQAEIANWVGVSRETLVRVFARWRSRGIIRRGARPLTILDLDGLRAEAAPWGAELETPAALSRGDRPLTASGAASAARTGPRAPGRSTALSTGRSGERTGGWSAERPAARPVGGFAVRMAVRPSLAIGRDPNAAGSVWLPPDSPYFTGRGADLARLNLLLAVPGRPRVLVIRGRAGVGKTALALRWARQVADRFPDGMAFLDLRGESPRTAVSPAEALGQALRGLGIPGDQVPAGEGELVALYQFLMTDRRVLLLLDNAADYEQIRPLLPDTDTCQIVITSRTWPTGLPAGEWVGSVELEALPPEEAVELVQAMLGAGDRRIAEEPRATAELVRECGGLPLALGIVAARLAEDRQKSIAETVVELAGRDRVSAVALPGDPRDALRTTFEVAYQNLGTDLRWAFRRLGLALGPDFTADSVAALLGRAVAAAETSLAALKRAHLVDDAAPGRYRLHDQLREFAVARGLLEDTDGERREAQRGLLSYYLNEALAAGTVFARHRRSLHDGSPDGVPGGVPGDACGGVPGEAGDGAVDGGAVDGGAAVGEPRRLSRSIAWFEAERHSLVAAVRQAARLGLHRTAWQLADALYDFLEFRSYSRDNIVVHNTGLEAARTAENYTAAAVMLHSLAVAHLELGRCVQAIGYDEEARRGFRALGDQYGEATALDNLADVHAVLGRYPVAIENATWSLAIYRRLGDRWGESEALDTLSQNYRLLGDYGRALDHARTALRIRRSIGDHRGEAETLLNLARVHWSRGASHRAVRYALEALDIRQGLGDRHGEAEAYSELARIHQRLGMREVAQRDAHHALTIYRAVGARRGEGEALVTLGWLMCDDGRYTQAFTYCADALRLQRAIGHRHGEAEAMAQIGVVHWRRGRFHEAREQLQRSLEVRREIGDRRGEAHDLERLSRVMRRLHRDQEAFVLGLESYDLWQELDIRDGVASALGGLARTYLRLRLYDEAKVAAEQALEVRREIDDRGGLAQGLDTLALVLRRTGRPAEALDIALDALRVLGGVGTANRYIEATALGHLANIYLDLERLPEARETAEQALALSAELGDYRNQAYSLHTMARACQRMAGHPRAIEHFTEEIEIRRETGDHRSQLTALRRMRESYQALGDQDAAADCTGRIRAIEQWLSGDVPA